MRELISRAYGINMAPPGAMCDSYQILCYGCGRSLRLGFCEEYGAEPPSVACCGYQYRLEIPQIDLVVEKEVS